MNMINTVDTEGKETDSMIVLDYRDRRPLYEQVIERLQELMFQGALPEDTQLPSVRSLATELSINPNTIQRAYGELERLGYIYSVNGKGSFVADWSRIRIGMKEEWRKQFDEAVKYGFRIGVGYEEMRTRLERYDKELKAGAVKGGESSDKGSGPDEAV